MKANQLILFLILIIFLPLAGVFFADVPLSLYTIISPYAINISSLDALPEQPFSWLYSIILIAFGMFLSGAFFYQLFRAKKSEIPLQASRRPFPWWGWVGIISLFTFWAIAWMPPAGMGIFKHLTFTFLWCSYITVVNAITYSRTGKCLLINRTRYILKLFLFSIPFWWYFEYLNRFVLNWYYLVADTFHSYEYLLFGSLAFGTVLPAVLSTRELLLSFPAIQPGFDGLAKLTAPQPNFISVIVAIIASLSLALVGVWPQHLYPLLWISPLLLLISLQSLWGKRHIFDPLAQGNYSSIVAAAVAALICGFVWEIWNFYSAPKWVYSVPFVHGFKIFEMPIAGYLGYLPFGLECLAIGELINEN